MKRLRTNHGYTIIELLIALFMTGLISMAGFQFYVAMHNSTIVQEEVSEMQNNCRASLDDIIRNLRMAGYRVGGHVPYSINGDSLCVYYLDSASIDTVLYYLASYTTSELATLPSYPDGLVPRKLMKQENGAAAAVFSDYIHDITYTAVSSSTVEVTLEVQSSRPDEGFAENEGYRILSATETVNLRNLML